MSRAGAFPLALVLALTAAGGCATTATPPTAEPPPAPELTPTFHPEPSPSGAVVGSIRWQNVEGDKSVVRYIHEASSSEGEIRQMRHSRGLTCAGGPSESWSDWGPFVSEVDVRTYSVGHFDQQARFVQYRDAAGNVSEPYCAEMVVVVPSPSPIVRMVGPTPTLEP